MPYQDGTFPSGSPVLAINNVNYKCNSFAVSKGSKVVDITDNVGDPSGALGFRTPRTATAELQLAASTTIEPTTAAANANTGTFIAVVDNANVNFFIVTCVVTKPKDAPWTAAITAQEKIN